MREIREGGREGNWWKAERKGTKKRWHKGGGGHA